MWPLTFLVSVPLFVILIFPCHAKADLRLYVGNLEVVSTSGKACKEARGHHRVSLVLGSDDELRNFKGILGGDNISVGRFSGSSLENLAVTYPYSDSALAEGHSLKITVSGTTLTGELRDKHVDASAEDCNFDLASLTLKQSEPGEAAVEIFQQYSAQFEAQLARSKAISLLRSKEYGAAALKYEEALTFADMAYPNNSPKLATFLAGLASSYMRLGRFADFVNLYAERYPEMNDDAVRVLFNGYLIKSQLHLGRAAVGRENYSAALEHFNKVLAVDRNNKDAIAAIMSTFVKSGQHDEAITFLEQTEKNLESDPDRRDVRGAIALVQYLKAIKLDKSGKYAEAEASLQKAISLDHETVQYTILLARWRHKSGKYHEADAILKKAAEHFKDESARLEISAARDRLRMTEMILKKIRRSGG